ncbi:MAG: hypothetical protein WBB23_23865 [Desulforhopalus sp.]
MEKETEKKLTAGELMVRKITADKIKKTAMQKLKVNIFFFVLGAGVAFFGLTYYGQLNINCLAEKGYVPQTIVAPYNQMLLKVRVYLNG